MDPELDELFGTAAPPSSGELRGAIRSGVSEAARSNAAATEERSHRVVAPTDYRGGIERAYDDTAELGSWLASGGGASDDSAGGRFLDYVSGVDAPGGIQTGDQGPIAAFMSGVGQGATFNMSDELAAAVDAGAVSGPEYERSRDANRERLRRNREAHGGLHVAGELVGAAAPALASGGASRAASAGMGLAPEAGLTLARAGGRLAGRTALGVAEGAGLGGAYGYGAGEGDEAESTRSGMLWGGALGGALTAVPGAVGAVTRRAGDYAPVPAAAASGLADDVERAVVGNAPLAPVPEAVGPRWHGPWRQARRSASENPRVTPRPRVSDEELAAAAAREHGAGRSVVEGFNESAAQSGVEFPTTYSPDFTARMSAQEALIANGVPESEAEAVMRSLGYEPVPASSMGDRHLAEVVQTPMGRTPAPPRGRAAGRQANREAGEAAAEAEWNDFWRQRREAMEESALAEHRPVEHPLRPHTRQDRVDVVPVRQRLEQMMEEMAGTPGTDPAELARARQLVAGVEGNPGLGQYAAGGIDFPAARRLLPRLPEGGVRDALEQSMQEAAERAGAGEQWRLARGGSRAANAPAGRRGVVGPIAGRTAVRMAGRALGVPWPVTHGVLQVPGVRRAVEGAGTGVVGMGARAAARVADSGVARAAGRAIPAAGRYGAAVAATPERERPAEPAQAAPPQPTDYDADLDELFGPVASQDHDAELDELFGSSR